MPSGCCASTWSGATARRARQSASSLPARRGSTLHQLCLDQGYTFLTFPETIGGRYSVGSDVGLFPMAVAGVDIRALVQGMRDMRDTLLAAPAEENPALRYACLRRLLLEHGYRLEMLSFFEPRLDYFAKWWIQLFAESEGKEGNALYPVAASNSGKCPGYQGYGQDHGNSGYFCVPRRDERR